MTKIKAIFGLLGAVAAAVVLVVSFGAAQASASSAPLAFTYEKACDETVGHCTSSPGARVTLDMQLTNFRATGSAAQLTFTERVTVGDVSFTAVLSGQWVGVPEGFIVLNGTVTGGSFAGAQIHQRSDFVGRLGSVSTWTGELLLMPAS